MSDLKGKRGKTRVERNLKRKKKMREFLGLGLTICMTMALSLHGVQTVNAFAKSAQNPGEVVIDKTATIVDEKDDTYKVNLEIDSKDVVSTEGTADIVLVVDTSGSMDGDRITKAKEAAKKFVDELVVPGGNNRISIITYASEPTVISGFSNDKEELSNKIDTMYAAGTTHTQGGIYEARLLLDRDSRANVKKCIVLIGDGDANECYQAIGFSDDKLEVIHNDDGTHVINKLADPDIYDYSEIWEWNYDIDAKKQCPICNKEITQTISGSSSYSNAAINEANTAKSTINSLCIYSIGINLYGSAEKMLNTIQNSGYYNIKDASELEPLLQTIAAQISKSAGTSAVVEDVLGDDFTMVDGTMTTSIGTADYDEANKTINWNIGSIEEKDSITLSYEVKLNDTAKKPGKYDTNKYAKLSYVDYQGNAVTSDFPIPTVYIGVYRDVTIKYVEEGTNKELIKSTTIKDQAVGDSIDVKSYIKTIEGYDLKDIGTETLVVNEDATKNVVTITYKAKAKENKPAVKDENPKTGDYDNRVELLVASMIVLGTLVFVKNRKRKSC